jgi:hypothetical protein
MKKVKKLAVGGAFTSTPATAPVEPKRFVSAPTIRPPTQPTPRTPVAPPRAGTYGTSYKGLNKTLQNYLNSQQVGGAARFGYDPVGRNFRTMEGAGMPVFANMQQMQQAARGYQRAQRRGQQFTPNFKSGGKASSASKRGDGIAQKGKTKGRMV